MSATQFMEMLQEVEGIFGGSRGTTGMPYLDVAEVASESFMMQELEEEEDVTAGKETIVDIAP